MKSTAIRVLAILALVAIPAFASPIYVNNFSFEEVTGGVALPISCTGNCAVSNGNVLPILGWTGSATGPWGQWQPMSAANGFWSVGPNPDQVPAGGAGPTVAYLEGGTISQSFVIPTINSTWMYTLQVDIGDRLDYGVAGVLGTADLKICAGASCTTIVATGTAPAVGGFSTYTATYLATAADTGKSLTIELNSTGAQGDFDNVRLDAVPEPASFLLIGPALFALSAIRRRRANS
jgi:hypothetical protein